MEDAERLALLREVFEKFYRGTETFEYVGEQLAYLLGAIINGGKYSVIASDAKANELDDTMCMLFEAEHPVWNFIERK